MKNEKFDIKYKKFEVEIYNKTVHFFKGKNMDKLIKKAEKKLNSQFNIEGSYDGLFIVENDKDFIILLESKKDKVFEDSVLHHECNHATFLILESKGIPINLNNDETFCYLSQYLFRKCKSNI